MPIKKKYEFEFVLCADTTGSMMLSDFFEELKESLPSFRKNFIEFLQKSAGVNPDDSDIDIRLKLISFKDYAFDAENAMQESRFFTLDAEADDLRKFMDGIELGGGGDEPENALEALALALESDWTTAPITFNTGNMFRRKCIVLWTDAPALMLGERAGCYGYPEGIPENFNELHDWWEEFGKNMRRKNRLILFVPNEYPWDEIDNEWSYTWVQDINTLDIQTFYDVLARALFATW